MPKSVDGGNKTRFRLINWRKINSRRKPMGNTVIDTPKRLNKCPLYKAFSFIICLIQKWWDLWFSLIFSKTLKRAENRCGLKMLDKGLFYWLRALNLWCLWKWKALNNDSLKRRGLEINKSEREKKPCEMEISYSFNQ